MKIAAGCFGCLTLLCLVVLVSGMAVPYVITPDAGEPLTGTDALLLGQAGLMQMIGGSCCCLSGAVTIILLAVGSMGKKEETYE